MQWPPDYKAVFAERIARHRVVEQDFDKQAVLRKYYETHPVEFIQDWGITYDPRNAAPGSALPPLMPFTLFTRQVEWVEWVVDLIEKQEDGLTEKSRDMGATWLGVAVSVWLWLFHPGAAVGWGSLKAAYVDKRGDPKSIFEKIRMYVGYLPAFLLPEGLTPDRHLTHMNCVNPVNGATIIGEIGDDIGRGGRTLVYFKDESAHYERADEIEASLGDNTNVQIDISSVNGEGNAFHKRRMTLPADSVFIFDWRDHPLKTQEWYDKRKAKYEALGLAHIFAQEVDRDYAAAILGVCIPSAWVKAAVGLKLDDSGSYRAGLDVATEGGYDQNALTIRKGPAILPLPKHERVWRGLDGTETAYKADRVCLHRGCVPGETVLSYDAHGVGASIQAPAKRTKLIFKPCFVGSTKLRGAFEPVIPLPGSSTLPIEETDEVVRQVRKMLYKDMYRDLKAKLWGSLSLRFFRTWQYVNGEALYHHDDLISIPERGYDDLIMQLSQPRMFTNDAGKKHLESKEKLRARGIDSPDEAESLVLSYDEQSTQVAEPNIRRL